MIIVCASRLLVSYQTQELFGVQNHTFWYGYAVFERLSEHGVGSYTSDQWLDETGWSLLDMSYERGLPYTLREDTAFNSSVFYLLEGAVEHPGSAGFPVRNCGCGL